MFHRHDFYLMMIWLGYTKKKILSLFMMQSNELQMKRSCFLSCDEIQEHSNSEISLASISSNDDNINAKCNDNTCSKLKSNAEHHYGYMQ